MIIPTNEKRTFYCFTTRGRKKTILFSIILVRFIVVSLFIYLFQKVEKEKKTFKKLGKNQKA